MMIGRHTGRMMRQNSWLSLAPSMTRRLVELARKIQHVGADEERRERDPERGVEDDQRPVRVVEPERLEHLHQRDQRDGRAQHQSAETTIATVPACRACRVRVRPKAAQALMNTVQIAEPTVTSTLIVR